MVVQQPSACLGGFSLHLNTSPRPPPPPPAQWYFLQREQPGINKGLMGRILEGGSALPMETDQFRGSHSHS